MKDDFDYNHNRDVMPKKAIEEETFFETFDRVWPDWRRWALACALAVPIVIGVIYVYETFIV